MKAKNFTARHWVQKIVLSLSLLFLLSMPLLAQTGGPHHPHHTWGDSVPPPPPPPPHHGNDSAPPPPPPPPPPPHHGNDTTPPPPPPPPPGDSTHHHGWDSIPQWNDSTPPPPPPPHHCDSLPPHWGDTTHRHWDSIPHWNDSIPPPPPPPHHGNDTIHHCGGDSIGIQLMKMGYNSVRSSIYPNPVTESAKLHIENASGSLTFNLYGQWGGLVMTIPNVANTDMQFYKGNLMPGVYIYELRNGNSVVSTGRVVVQ